MSSGQFQQARSQPGRGGGRRQAGSRAQRPGAAAGVECRVTMTSQTTLPGASAGSREPRAGSAGGGGARGTLYDPAAAGGFAPGGEALAFLSFLCEWG